MILIWPFSIILQIVSVRHISRSHGLKIDFRNENFKSYHQVDFYKVFFSSNFALWAKNGTAPEVTCCVKNLV